MDHLKDLSATLRDSASPGGLVETGPSEVAEVKSPRADNSTTS